MALSESDYPELLRDGDVIATAYRALRARLELAFPPLHFRHGLLPPHATKKTWDEILRSGQHIRVGFEGWKPKSGVGNAFRGDLSFPVFGVLNQPGVEQLYCGSGQLRGVGVFGLTAMFAGFLHGFTVKGVGRCVVRELTLPPAAEWLDDRCAIVGVSAVFEDVALDGADVLAQLAEFLRLGETWEVDGGDPLPEAVLDVRGGGDGEG
ncbi:hypothetical protein LWC05_12010 [Acetobacter sicerae]|uniref:Uncharacterized protein n=1 Tax=Acetobacter sicerae TaxID=85325 RepID=A0ABS8W033_9PROT|nr:hypothetical protein [Acetobacter sicerae]MCE0744607.1 hypothetical protein [Acetobacter sicerae]